MSNPTGPGRLSRLALFDALNVSRDPMLLIALVMSAAPALMLAIWRADIDAAANAAFGVAAFSHYAIPTALLLPALLIGWVVGFLVLEDRDDGPLLAVAVTPLGTRGYLGYRAALAAALTTLLTVYGIALLLPGVTPAIAVLLVLLIAAESVLAAAILPSVARNKVEGLAVTKLTNLTAIVPLAALLPAPWRYLFGIIPSYWLGELLLVPPGDGIPLPLTAILAIAIHAAVAVLLIWRFRR